MTTFGWSWMKVRSRNDQIRMTNKIPMTNEPTNWSLRLWSFVGHWPLVILILIPSSAIAARTGPFIIGADISWVPEDEAAGAQYFDHGVQKDIFTILKDHGFNYIRLRVF